MQHWNFCLKKSVVYFLIIVSVHPGRFTFWANKICFLKQLVIHRFISFSLWLVWGFLVGGIVKYNQWIMQSVINRLADGRQLGFTSPFKEMNHAKQWAAYVCSRILLHSYGHILHFCHFLIICEVEIPMKKEEL